jgi:hypothetical protein
MKSLLAALVLILSAVVVAPAWAAEAAPSLPWQPVVIALVPIAIALLKWVLARASAAVPDSVRQFFGTNAGVMILGLAPILGMAAESLIAWVNGQVANPSMGAVYGALGVFLRELVDQLRKSDLTPDWLTPRE